MPRIYDYVSEAKLCNHVTKRLAKLKILTEDQVVMLEHAIMGDSLQVQEEMVVVHKRNMEYDRKNPVFIPRSKP